MTGSLPLTTDGTPSYSLAKTRMRSELDEAIWRLQDEFGLTDLEVADVLHELTRDRLRDAVEVEQNRSSVREGTIGTPRQDGEPS